MRTLTSITAGMAALACAGAGVGTAAAAPSAAPVRQVRAASSSCNWAKMVVGTPLSVKVGQMIMVGNPATGVNSTVLSEISNYHVGNIFLSGRTTGGVSQVAGVTAALRSRYTLAATAGLQPFIATDQEGGYVQVLQGPGFSRIPEALQQQWPYLYYYARTWGSQMKAAGVNMNLAPVADTVPSWLGRGNAPIGYWFREYGYGSGVVTTYTNAFAWGMRAAGVAPTVKHFPGLGLVRYNTDTTTYVYDTLMTRYGDYSTYLNPFKKAAQAGVPFTMMSSAIYDKIDPTQPAVFSPTIVQSVLRSQVGFGGVVMSDDIGGAAAMSPYSYATRAIRSVNAGVQLLLTGVPGSVPAMYDALLARAKSDSSFGYKINVAVGALYRAKQAYGLLPPTC